MQCACDLSQFIFIYVWIYKYETFNSSNTFPILLLCTLLTQETHHVYGSVNGRRLKNQES